MPASVDNIKRVQDKIEGLKAQKYANFEKALKLAFTLFRKVSMQMKRVASLVRWTLQEVEMNPSGG